MQRRDFNRLTILGMVLFGTAGIAASASTELVIEAETSTIAAEFTGEDSPLLVPSDR